MKKIGNKGITGVGVILLLALVAIAFMIGRGAMFTAQPTGGAPVTTGIGEPFQKAYTVVEVTALDPSLQDNEADWDIDIYECNANDIIECLEEACDDSYLCPTPTSGSLPPGLNYYTVKPIEVDAGDWTVYVEDHPDAIVPTNTHWWILTAAGNSDNTLNSEPGLVLVGTDKEDWIYNSSSKTLIRPGKLYITCIEDSSEPADIATIKNSKNNIGMCFAWKSPERTTLDLQDVASGNAPIIFYVKAWSDCLTESKKSVGGDCEDDAGNTATLDSSLNGAIPTSHTTAAATDDLFCDVEVETSSDYCALIFTNPVVGSDADKAYAQFEPYCNNLPSTNLSLAYIAKCTEDTKTHVVYSSTSQTTAGNYSIAEELTVCGHTLLDSNTGGSLLSAGYSKLYYPSSLTQCLSDVYGKDTLTFKVKVMNVRMDYDASTNSSDNIIEANSGTSPEAIVDLSVFLPTSTTDVVNQNLHA